MSKKYIAYGSNLSVEQMAFRCPEAKIIGMADPCNDRACCGQSGAGPDLGNHRPG